MSELSDAIRRNINRPAPDVVAGFQALATTSVAELLDLDCVMRPGMGPLWPGIARIAGPAFTVRTLPHDLLALHAAIYLAAAGDVIVVEAGDAQMAVAGGNVCAIAQRRGVAGFVVDGLVRDWTESRARGFPIYARGYTPKPGGRDRVGGINHPIRCGGVAVSPGDVVVADEEGIVVVPLARAPEIMRQATAKAAAEAVEPLDAWQARHRARVEAQLEARGLTL